MIETLAALGISQAAQLLYPVLEDIAKDYFDNAAQNYVSEAFKNVYSAINRKSLSKATLQALNVLLDLIENELLDNDVPEERVRSMTDAIKVFLRKQDVQKTLAELFLEPDYQLDPKMFAHSWEQLPYPWSLPEDFSWQRIAKRFARKVRDIRDSDVELKQTFDNLQQRSNADALKELQGLPPDFDLDLYREALVERFGNLSLDSMDTSGAYYAVQLWSVFVPQSVRECHTYRPQLLELPKEHLQRLLDQGEIDEAELRELQKQETEQQRSSFLEQPLQPVMDLLKPENLDGNIVILGDPGSGKSSLLRFLALEWARNENANQRYSQTLPLLIELRDYNRWHCPSGKSFLRYLHEASTWHRLNQHTLDYLLKQDNRVLLLLDGLDEVFDPFEREQVMNDIHRFSNEYKHTRIIVTSRVVGYKAQRLRDAEFRDFMLQDLDAAQIEDFLQRWHSVAFSDKADGERKRERLAKAIDNAQSINMLAGNPLLLTMMAIINRYQELPRDRVMLYQKASEVLLQQWDTERGLQDFPGLSNDIDLRAKNAILRRIAYTMQTGKAEGQAANIIHVDALLKLIEDYLREELHFEQARAAANALIEQLRARNFILCFLGADSYAFVHRTFLEYYCAAELVHQFHVEKTLDYAGLEKVFDDYCRDDDWREVLRLVCGQIDEGFVGQIVEFLATRTDLDSWDGSVGLLEIPLAILCLGETRKIDKLKKPEDTLLSAIIQIYCLDIQEAADIDIILEILNAIEEVIQRGLFKKAKNTAISIVNKLSHEGRLYWPQFIGITSFDKKLILDFMSSEFHEIRWDAIDTLAKYWPTEDTRLLLEKLAVADEHQLPRRAALMQLTYNWPDDVVRKLLTKQAIQDKSEFIRSTILGELIKTWSDNNSHGLLQQRAVEDEHESPRRVALEALGNTWPNDETRCLLQQRAVKDEHESPRCAALEILVNTWPNDDTRRLLEQRTVEDGHESPRRTALEALVKDWPDDDTRRLLEQRAVEDEDQKPRRAALEALVNAWLDGYTQQLLVERAPLDGVAAYVRGKQHSRFGEIVFTEELYSHAPYLNPRQAIPHEHIKKAAEAANVPADKIEETVKALSAFLGWDITMGSEQGTINNEDSEDTEQ